MPPDRLLQLSWLSPWVGQDPLMAIPSIDPSCVFGALYTLCHFATWFQVFTMDGGTCDFLHHIIVNSILNLPGLSERNSSCAIIYVICHMSYAYHCIVNSPTSNISNHLREDPPHHHQIYNPSVCPQNLTSCLHKLAASETPACKW